MLLCCVYNHFCDFDAMWFIMTYTYTQEHTYLGYKESPYTATVLTYISSPKQR